MVEHHQWSVRIQMIEPLSVAGCAQRNTTDLHSPISMPPQAVVWTLVPRGEPSVLHHPPVGRVRHDRWCNHDRPVPPRLHPWGRDVLLLILQPLCDPHNPVHQSGAVTESVPGCFSVHLIFLNVILPFPLWLYLLQQPDVLVVIPCFFPPFYPLRFQCFL